MRFFPSFLLFILIPFSAWGIGPSKTLKTVQGELPLILKNELWVSPHCHKTPCLALKRPAKSAAKTEGSPYITQPAASFCESHGGKYLIGKYSSGNEDGICRFKDQSYILAWDYYYKFREQKK